MLTVTVRCVRLKGAVPVKVTAPTLLSRGKLRPKKTHLQVREVKKEGEGGSCFLQFSCKVSAEHLFQTKKCNFHTVIFLSNRNKYFDTEIERKIIDIEDIGYFSKILKNRKK